MLESVPSFPNTPGTPKLPVAEATSAGGLNAESRQNAEVPCPASPHPAGRADLVSQRALSSRPNTQLSMRSRVVVSAFRATSAFHLPRVAAGARTAPSAAFSTGLRAPISLGAVQRINPETAETQRPTRLLRGTIGSRAESKKESVPILGECPAHCAKRYRGLRVRPRLRVRNSGASGMPLPFVFTIVQ